MPMPKYFFVYVILVDDRIESHVVGGENWDTLIRTKAIIQNGIVVSNLLYLSNVKQGTHRERLARGEVPPQAKSPYDVSAIARGEVAGPKPHRFHNAGIGLTPDSVCVVCKGLASDHPEMEVPLAVMARVQRQRRGGANEYEPRDPAPEDTGGAEDPPYKPRCMEDGPAPAEDAFQVGAGGEAGPHIKVDVSDPEYGVGAQNVEASDPQYVCATPQCPNDARLGSNYCGSCAAKAAEPNIVC